MPAITITGGSVCSGGEHRVVETDLGDVAVSNTEISNAIPGGLSELKEAFIIVARHQYLTRRAAGRTHNQALADLVGFTVRL